jgi:hypothetical protein
MKASFHFFRTPRSKALLQDKAYQRRQKATRSKALLKDKAYSAIRSTIVAKMKAVCYFSARLEGSYSYESHCTPRETIACADPRLVHVVVTPNPISTAKIRKRFALANAADKTAARSVKAAFIRGGETCPGRSANSSPRNSKAGLAFLRARRSIFIIEK